MVLWTGKMTYSVKHFTPRFMTQGWSLRPTGWKGRSNSYKRSYAQSGQTQTHCSGTTSSHHKFTHGPAICAQFAQDSSLYVRHQQFPLTSGILIRLSMEQLNHKTASLWLLFARKQLLNSSELLTALLNGRSKQSAVAHLSKAQWAGSCKVQSSWLSNMRGRQTTTRNLLSEWFFKDSVPS